MLVLWHLYRITIRVHCLQMQHMMREYGYLRFAIMENQTQKTTTYTMSKQKDPQSRFQYHFKKVNHMLCLYSKKIISPCLYSNV